MLDVPHENLGRTDGLTVPRPEEATLDELSEDATALSVIYYPLDEQYDIGSTTLCKKRLFVIGLGRVLPCESGRFLRRRAMAETENSEILFVSLNRMNIVLVD